MENQRPRLIFNNIVLPYEMSKMIIKQVLYMKQTRYFDLMCMKMTSKVWHQLVCIIEKEWGYALGFGNITSFDMSYLKDYTSENIPHSLLYCCKHLSFRCLLRLYICIFNAYDISDNFKLFMAQYIALNSKELAIGLSSNGKFYDGTVPMRIEFCNYKITGHLCGEVKDIFLTTKHTVGYQVKATENVEYQQWMKTFYCRGKERYKYTINHDSDDEDYDLKRRRVSRFIDKEKESEIQKNSKLKDSYDIGDWAYRKLFKPVYEVYDHDEDFDSDYKNSWEEEGWW